MSWARSRGFYWCSVMIIIAANLCSQGYCQTWPHEPPGSSLITDWSFDNLVGDGWSNDGGLSIVTDGTAPMSPPNVVDFYYPIGFPAGVGPGTVFHQLPPTNKLYIGYWWKPSKPWQGHPSNVNKISFEMGNSNNLIQTMWGAGNGPFRLMNTLEFPTVDNSHIGNGYGDSPGSWNLFGNASECDVTLGQWHRVEIMYMRSTSQTSRDGVLKWWLDGVLCGSYTDVNFPSEIFTQFEFAPTWGGIGGNKTEADHYWFDHVRISRPSTSTLAAPTGLTVQ